MLESIESSFDAPSIDLAALLGSQKCGFFFFVTMTYQSNIRTSVDCSLHMCVEQSRIHMVLEKGGKLGIDKIIIEAYTEIFSVIL